MRAGSLKSLIDIKRPPVAVDAVGQPAGDWTLVARVRADIRHLSGLETLKGDAATSLVNTSIRIRYREDIDAGMRAYHGTTVYEINAVLPALRRKHVDLVCRRGVL